MPGAWDLVKDDIVKSTLLRVMAKDARGFRINDQPVAPGLVQTVSELTDLIIEGKEATKAGLRHLDKAMSDNIEVYGKMLLRDGVRHMARGLGINTFDDSLFASGEIGKTPDLKQQFDRSVWKEDLNQFRTTMNRMRDAMEYGDFVGAGRLGASLKSMRSVQFFKRFNRIYTYTLPYDVRGTGSVMPIAQGGPAYGLLNLETGLTSQSVNNVWNKLKAGAKNLISNEVEYWLGDIYAEANRTSRETESKMARKTGINMYIADRAFAKAEPKLLTGRRRAGFQVRLIHRVHWHKALGQGFGAKIVSRALKDQNVPIRKRSILNSRDSDDLCRNNARQGWIDNDAEFRSGHGIPPFHPGCKCKLRLSVKNSDEVNKIVRPVTQPRFLNINRRSRRRGIPSSMRTRIPRVMRSPRIPASPIIGDMIPS